MKTGIILGLITAWFAGAEARAQVWSGELAGPDGGYPRMAQMPDGTLVMGVDVSDAIHAYKSTNGGDSWMALSGGAPAVPNPSSVNEKVGNVFPLALPNGDLLIACRHLNDTDDYDISPDGIKFFNIDLHKSTDGGATWSYLSSPINDPRSPGGGLAADQSEGAWEPFLYQYSPTEIWCLYSRQNAGRDSHPLFLNMKRSTDGGATWGAEETVVGVPQFGSNGSAGMNAVVKAGNGDLLVVFETQSPNGNWFSIGMVRSTDNGSSWGSISTVYDQAGSGVYGAGAPYIVKLNDGMLVVSYQHGTDTGSTSGTGRMGYVTSTDNGSTWNGNTDLFPPETLWNGLFVDADGVFYGMTSGVRFKKYYPNGVPSYTNEPFRLFAKHSNKVLAVDFAGANPTNGAAIRQTGLQGADSQKWIRHDEGGGFFSLEPASGLGKRLSVDPSAAQGKRLYLWDAGGEHQKWYVVAEAGYYKMVNKVSGFVVDVWGNDAADGADGVLWENLGGGNQLFSTLMDNGSQLNPFKNFVKKPRYKIINKQSGKVADLAAGGTADGTNIQQWDYNGTSAQKWAVNKLENGYFWLEPEAAPGKSLQLDGFSSSNGENITLWSYDGNNNKKWSVPSASGETYFKLENKHSSKVVEVAGGSLSNGGNLQQWDNIASGDDHQKWRFDLVSSFAAPATPLLGNVFPNRISLNPGRIGNSQEIFEDEDPAPFSSDKSALGNGVVSYQWQWTLTPASGGSWLDLPGETNATYTAPNLNGAFQDDTEVFVRRRAVDTYYTMDSNEVSLMLIKINTFEKWAEDHALAGADADRGADPDEDGLDNLAEYALGGDPNVDDAATILPTSEILGVDTWEYVYNRRIDAADRGLAYDLGLTGDLQGNWTSVSNAYETGAADLDAYFESVTNTIPISGLNQEFIHLKITEN